MKKYGMVVKLNEEFLQTIFSKELLKKPSEELAHAVKCISLANQKVPVDKWSSVECEVMKDCLTDTYMFRLRSFVEMGNFYEIRAPGSEYPKRPLKGNYDD